MQTTAQVGTLKICTDLDCCVDNAQKASPMQEHDGALVKESCAEGFDSQLPVDAKKRSAVKCHLFWQFLRQLEKNPDECGHLLRSDPPT